MTDMVASNAGIKRNRLPAGVKGVNPDLVLRPSTVAAFKDAARASGHLSLSLYLELLRQQLEDEHGALPVLSPQIDDEKELHTTAA